MPDSPYERAFFVCVYGPWCRLDGSVDVHKELKARTKEAGLHQQVRITKCGCLGQCGNGPMIASFPDNAWYHGVQVADVPEIFASHVVGGEPVERLRWRPATPGTNKTPEVIEKESKKKG